MSIPVRSSHRRERHRRNTVSEACPRIWKPRDYGAIRIGGRSLTNPRRSPALRARAKPPLDGRLRGPALATVGIVNLAQHIIRQTDTVDPSAHAATAAREVIAPPRVPGRSYHL